MEKYIEWLFKILFWGSDYKILFIYIFICFDTK